LKGAILPCFQIYGDAYLTADAHVLGLRMLTASAARPTIFGHAWAWQ
jgi:hypothetical protein